MTVLGAVSFGSIYAISVYCAQIQGCISEQIGYVVMWSGLPQLVPFPLMPILMRRFDPRMLVVAGALLFTVPLSQMSTAGLGPRDTADASALSNMMRNLGGSIGVSTCTSRCWPRR